MPLAFMPDEDDSFESAEIARGMGHRYVGFVSARDKKRAGAADALLIKDSIIEGVREAIEIADNLQFMTMDPDPEKQKHMREEKQIGLLVRELKSIEMAGLRRPVTGRGDQAAVSAYAHVAGNEIEKVARDRDPVESLQRLDNDVLEAAYQERYATVRQQHRDEKRSYLK